MLYAENIQEPIVDELGKALWLEAAWVVRSKNRRSWNRSRFARANITQRSWTIAIYAIGRHQALVGRVS